jgi:hypothetical protein
MIALALALSLAAGDPCEDVFDRTADCEAVDVEALDVRMDGAATVGAEVSADDFGWRLLAASGIAATLGGAMVAGVFAYDAHLAALRDAGTATPEAVDELLLQRSVVGWAALGSFVASGLLLGSSGAFLIFDPARGVAREPFRITGE